MVGRGSLVCSRAVFRLMMIATSRSGHAATNITKTVQACTYVGWCCLYLSSNWLPRHKKGQTGDRKELKKICSEKVLQHPSTMLSPSLSKNAWLFQLISLNPGTINRDRNLLLPLIFPPAFRLTGVGGLLPGSKCESPGSMQ